MAEKTAVEQNRRAVLNTLKGSSGNLVEWYDVYIYTVFATYFERQFFAAEDTNSTIYVYAIFAVTFLMRPVGSWFFGRYADRHGRRAALVFSVTLMAGCSFVIAITPTRAIDRCVRRGHPDPLPARAGLRDGRRVRHVRHVHVGGGHPRAARLLLVLPVRDAHRWARAGAADAPAPVHVPDRGPDPGLRLADPVRHRRSRRAGGAVVAADDGRVAVGGAARRGEHDASRRFAAHPVRRLLAPAAAVLPDHDGRHDRVLHLQRQRAGGRQGDLHGRRADRDLDQPDRPDLPDAAAATGRHAQRPGRPQTAAGRVRDRRGRSRPTC